MPVVVKTPIIEYDCDHCGARSRAKEEEFKPLHMMPPSSCIALRLKTLAAST